MKKVRAGHWRTFNCNLLSAEPAPARLSTILDTFFPPREFRQDGSERTQYVCKEPATRREVRALGELLDDKLQERQARQEGICEERRELHSQCFQEIIRQSTIICVERGLLMVRMRDEFRLSLQAGEVKQSLENLPHQLFSDFVGEEHCQWV